MRNRARQINPRTGQHIRIVEVLRVEDDVAHVRGVFGPFAGVEYEVPKEAVVSDDDAAGEAVSQ